MTPSDAPTPPADGPAAQEPKQRRRRLIANAQRFRVGAMERLERERERHVVVALAFLIADRGRQAAASVLAGALAFRLFLTLLPLTLVMVVGLGFLKDSGTQPSTALKEFGVKGALASTINHSADFTDPGRTAVLLLGLWALLTGARTTARTLRAIHALAWGIPVSRWRRSGVAGLLFLCAIVIAMVAGALASRARSQAGLAIGLGATIAMAATFTGGWLYASLLLPRREGTSWADLMPGSVLVGVGFAILQAVTVNWLGPKLSHESQLYGALGVSFVVLGWLYVVGRLMVAAPLINAAWLDHRTRAAARRDAEQEAQDAQAPAGAVSGVSGHDREAS
jgi:uncharacterized BrkB/YihY/UPF0761 family membrane protein